MPDPTKRKVRMIHVPWNYEWSRIRNTEVTQLGIIELPKQMADAAVRQGVAEPYPKPTRTSTRSSTSSDDESED